MTPQLVVFDMAGTTVADGDAVARCFQGALAGAGLPIGVADANAVMGLPKPEAIRILVDRSDRRDELTGRIDAIHRDFVARMLHFYQHDPDLAEVPGTSALFQDLRRAGIKVALNSGFSRDIARTIIDRLGWAEADLIDASLTSDEVARGRPHPDMIRKLMAAVGVDDPARVAKVGDTPVDLEEGHNAGCGWVIGVTEGTHTREQLAVYPHTHLIGTIADLPAVFGLVAGA